jgi:BirA family biotin operon repressor/biotin-[acetyl-CoA-carboxylase] ligase
VEPVLSSTNLTAKELAVAGAPEGTVVVADSQTAGRGRLGRTFASPTGGVYMSVVLRPAVDTDPGMVTACAAVAVARAIRRLCDLPVGIKWVNDLLIRGRKVCGILAEGGLNPATGGLSYIVLGIGVNVAAAVFPEELKPIVTTLEGEGATVDRATLIAAILEEWEAAYATLSTGDFLADYRRLSVVLGRQVTVWRGKDTFPAIAEAIDDSGHLVVRTAEDTITLRSGEVSIRL